MGLRRIIKIDEEKCDGCGLCVPACHEGAIQIIDGKARLVSEVYCDGLGDCLGECPQGAITIEEREAEDFDPEAVSEHLEKQKIKGEEKPPADIDIEPLPCGCPGTMSRKLEPAKAEVESLQSHDMLSLLGNWPVQIKLAPFNAPYFQGAKLTIAADCAPFAFADFHRRFLDGRILLIGCPKLDDYELYLKKLSRIFKRNDIKEIEVIHMEVPCCFGLVNLVRSAIAESGKDIPLNFIMIGINGKICDKKIPEMFLEEVKK